MFDSCNFSESTIMQPTEITKRAVARSGNPTGDSILRELRRDEDAEREGMGATRLAIAASQPPEQPRKSQPSQSQPIPLVRNVPPAASYPTDALGPILAPAARAIAELVQVPEALAGNSILAAAALAAQAHANVQTLGGVRPLSLYAVTVARSGERKTRADTIATEPIREHCAALHRGYKVALSAYKANPAAYDEPPRKPWFIATDPTAEGLIISLRDGQYSQGLFSDEAGTLIGGHALSEDAELRTVALWSRVWDGSALDRVRATDLEHVILYGRRLSIHLMAQPEVALKMLGKTLYRSQGFLARCLIAEPQSLIGTRTHNGSANEPEVDERVRQYCKAMANLLARPIVEHHELGGLNPPRLALDPDAYAALVSAYNEIEKAQSADGDLAAVTEFASKACEHACRIAGVLALVSDPMASTVSVENMTRALQLAKFYLSEQVRLAGSASISIEITNAQKLLDWIKAKGLTEITARQVMQRGPYSIRDAKSAKTALSTLVEYEWLAVKDSHRYGLTPGAQAQLAEG
ncbi:MAG TPA: YfjI family protein [Steroidobacteraceae bacterium]|nr:YfjI family protein [Steroidobacteraceae bacterium]